MSKSNNASNAGVNRGADLEKLSKDPLQILRMLSSLPPPKPTLLEEESRAPPANERPFESPVRTIKPLKPQFKHFTHESLEEHSRGRFSQLDIQHAQHNRLDLSLFKRKHRHVEDADETLSIISKRSTKSYSRFDRVFQKIPSTQELLDTQNLILSTPERLRIQKQLDSMEGIETEETQETIRTQQSLKEDHMRQVETGESPFHSTPVETQKSLFHSVPIETQESLFHSVLADTQETERSKQQKIVDEEEKREKTKSVSPPPPTQNKTGEPMPEIPITLDEDMDFGMDDADYGMGDDGCMEDDYVVEDHDQVLSDNMGPVDDVESISNTSNILPAKRVTQGSSFIRRKMNEPVTRYKKRLLIPHVKAKALFQSSLSFNKKLASTMDLSKATSLFCDQTVDDLKSYKENQPEEDQEEITDKDVILLMQRQRLISDKSSLEAMAQKYLPREYVDIVCQAALAYNELYPGFDQKYKDDFYYYNYDNANDEDEDE